MGNRMEYIPEKEISAILGQIEAIHPKYSLMLRIGVESGLRVSDVLRIRAGDVKREMRIWEAKTKKVKEWVPTVGLVEEMGKHVERYGLRERDYLIFSREGKDKAVHRTTAYRVLRAAGEGMGLSRIGTHSMRKTYARRVYRETGDIGEVQKRMGHEDVRTTLMYFFDVFELEKYINL